MIHLLLYLLLVLGIETATTPQATWNQEEPCGAWTLTCRSALSYHGLEPDEVVAQFHARVPGDGLGGGEWLTLLELFGWTQWCESRHDPLAIGDFDQFGRPHSRGLWQFSDTFQPQISDAFAFSPWASTYEAGKQWSEGYATRWSCYRIAMGRN